MKLPGAQKAVVDVAILRGYCLNPMQPRGRHRARVFASALQLFRHDAELLRVRLLEAALAGDVTLAKPTSLASVSLWISNALTATARQG